ncbi:MAG: hypothetical protein KJZ69_03600 [Phycisphaerales bacterium]|nr:hypothetical protein [Phycisphaerales bacterium]
MHAQTRPIRARRRRTSRPRPRGSVLILVVSVLVLLAVSAAVYVSVGQQERLAAAAGEMKLHREAVSAKVVDYLGQILVRDIFGNDAQATKPFEDRVADLGFGDLIVPERWDFPYTRPGNADVFDILADTWLADLEPSVYDPNTGEMRWRHISNIHSQGRFVSFDNFFTRRRSLGSNSSFYSDLFITGGNATPYALDTFTGGVNTPFNYNVQISRQITNDTHDGVVTWADRMAGADTDGDGRIDARWTELLDVYGLPKEMRIFVAARIIDASAMLNLNANLEFGATQANDASAKVGLGRTPADIDLYTLLFDGFQAWRGPADDNVFVSGGGVSGRYGFKEHIFATGIQSRFLQGGLGTTYSPINRSTRADRENFWNSFARRPDRAGAGLAPYGVADELELRTFAFLGNDRAQSRLETTFEGLDFDPADYRTWHSPLRGRMNQAGGVDPDWWEKVDFAAGTPTLAAIQRDYRHLLTTYNGSRPVRPWSLGYSDTDSPATLANLNSILAANQPTALQSVAGAFMWALAPQAVDVGNGDGSDSGRTIYGTNVSWWPSGSNESLHYGDGDAGYAFLKAAQLAVNAMDYYDQGSGPTIRTLVFDRAYTAPGREGKEIIGSFEHGKVPLQMTGPSGSQNGATITVIGLERQPFIREVCAVNVYGQLDDDPADQRWDYDPTEGKPEEWMVKILAVELGNPWPDDISTSGYRIRFGRDALNSWALPATTIGAGESVVFYIGVDNPDNGAQPNGRAAWESLVAARSATQSVIRIGDDTTHLEFEDATGEFDEITLWQNAIYGQPGVPTPVLVDRLRPATSNGDFPNIIDRESGENIPPPGNVLGEVEFTVRVGSMRRYCDTAGGGVAASFPGYIFQSPVIIATRGRESQDEFYNDVGGLGNIPPTLISDALDPPVEYINDPSDTKGYAQPVNFDAFQLHVADLRDNSDSTDQSFRSSVDLLLLSTAGHLHCQQIPGADPNFAEKGFYVTASELLGDESLRGRMMQDLGSVGVTNVPVLLDIIRPAGPGLGISYFPPDFRNDANGTPNPFVGRLDFTRFIPRSGNVALVTEALPLATRILDAFDFVSVDANVPLAQGRININTAPRQVLEALPFLHPRYAAGPVPQRDPNLRLAEALRAYRDQGSLDMTSVDWSAGPRHTVSNLMVGNNSGLRDDATTRGVTGFTPGFTSLGETLLATKWTPINGSGPSYEIDPSVSANELPYVGGRDNSNLTYGPLNPNGLSVDSAWESNYDPADDPSEHLALIRAIRNVVSTRSDVFIAYFTIVGFTPDDIRRADDASNSTVGKLTALRASMEQRYIVVFDRSSVSSPTDRPRVLFAAQEVPSR